MTNRILGKAPCRKCAAAEISRLRGHFEGLCSKRELAKAGEVSKGFTLRGHLRMIVFVSGELATRAMRILFA